MLSPEAEENQRLRAALEKLTRMHVPSFGWRSDLGKFEQDVRACCATPDWQSHRPDCVAMAALRA